MSNSVFYVYNRGIGDSSWIDRHNALFSLLEPFLKTDQCAVSAHACGFPCGGYLYQIEIRAPELEPLLFANGFENSASVCEEIQTLKKVVPFTKIVLHNEPASEKY